MKPPLADPSIRLPRPPAGLSVERSGGGVEVRVARWSAWRWPPGPGARRVLGDVYAVPLVGCVVVSVASMLDTGSDTPFEWVNVGLIGLIALLFAGKTAGDVAAMLRGPRVYRLPDVWADPDATAVKVFSLSGEQAFWWQRVVRRATRPGRLAARRKAAGGREAGEAVRIDTGGSAGAQSGLIGTVALTAAMAAAVGWLVATAPSVNVTSGWRDAAVAGLLGCGALTGWVALGALWPRVRRGQLTFTAAAVAVRTDRPWGVRWRRARLEEVVSVELTGRRGLIARRDPLGLPREPLPFDVPPGWAAGQFADEVRQLLGVARVDHGFPVVAVAAGTKS